MHPDLLELLMCTACGGDFELGAVSKTENAEIIEGVLACGGCGRKVSVSKGIPRFVEASDNYAENFGYQWNRWRDLQIDHRSGHRLSEDRFLADGKWPDGWLNGKLVLDAGCGAGRFADVALRHGARLVAVDLTEAVDACREVTAENRDNGHYLQASLFDLPFKPSVFDAVYCMGVLQHTPDPMGAVGLLPQFVKPGGRLALNFYEENLWRRLQVVKYAIRFFAKRLSVPKVLALSKILVGIFYPITRFLAPIPKVRQLNHFIPIAAVHNPQLTPEQQREWTLLDTFDWYGPAYENCLYHSEVSATLRSLGCDNVNSQPGLAWAMAPQARIEEQSQ